MDLHILEAVTLFTGDADPTQNTYLSIQTLRLPIMDENFVDHLAGGAPIGVAIPTHMLPLDATFNLAGFHLPAMTTIGRWARQYQSYTARGLIRSQRNGKAFACEAVMFGRIGRVAPGEYRRGDLHGHEFAIRGINKYRLKVGTTLVYDWDYYTSTRIVGGVDLNRDLNTILRIGTTDPAAASESMIDDGTTGGNAPAETTVA